MIIIDCISEALLFDPKSQAVLQEKVACYVVTVCCYSTNRTIGINNCALAILPNDLNILSRRPWVKPIVMDAKRLNLL